VDPLSPSSDTELGKSIAAPTAAEEMDEWTTAVIDETLRRVQAITNTTARPLTGKCSGAGSWRPSWTASNRYPSKRSSRKAASKSPQQAYNALNDAKRTFRRLREEVIKEYEQ